MSLREGITYFNKTGFSINEGKVPNIHISWNNEGRDGEYFYFYTRLWWLRIFFMTNPRDFHIEWVRWKDGKTTRLFTWRRDVK